MARVRIWTGAAVRFIIVSKQFLSLSAFLFRMSLLLPAGPTNEHE
jgi:hypothetical protein